jgi:hypothetical protein
MTKTQQQLSVLGALLVVLALMAYWRFGYGSAAATATPAGTTRQPSNQAARTGGGQDLPASGVRLEALKREAPAPSQSERNPFRFRPKAPPPPPPQAAPPPQTFVPPPVAGPPPPPPIPLRYVGYLAPSQTDRMAVLTDARGNPFYGREGDIIEGRYRVLRIAADSVDLAYADGRGRQTLRLSSQ